MTVTIEDGGTPELSSVLKSYVVKQGGVEVGTIDIPKDFLVKSAEVKTVQTADVPYAGAVVGDKYIDLEINAKTGGTEDSHIYIPIKDFFTPYKGGQTDTVSVDIGDDNTISASVKAGSITSALIADNAVVTTKINDGAVTTAKIADSAVTESKIGTGAVTTTKIGDDAVTNDKIADNAVGTAQLSAQAVETSKIADSAVTTDKINDGAVTEDKIDEDAVTNSKIADNAVGAAQLSAQAVETSKIADGAVTTVKIADDAVTNAKIADDAVGTDQLSASAVTTAKIADSAVTTAKIDDGAVTNAKLGSQAVTLSNLSSDVSNYIESQVDGAKDYVDEKVGNLNSTFTGAVSSTVVSMTESEGIVTLSAQPIAITTSQILDLSAVVGEYVPLSAASNSASGSDLLQTSSEVQTAITNAIDALDVDAVTATTGQTIKSVSEADGKISVEVQDI